MTGMVFHLKTRAATPATLRISYIQFALSPTFQTKEMSTAALSRPAAPWLRALLALSDAELVQLQQQRGRAALSGRKRAEAVRAFAAAGRAFPALEVREAAVLRVWAGGEVGGGRRVWRERRCGARFMGFLMR